MRFFKHLIAAAALAVFTTASAYAAPEIPQLRGRVNDYAEVLTPAEEQTLEGSLQQIEDTIEGHPQVVILTTPDLQGYDIAEYSLEVGRAWKIGQKDVNNGVLIVIHPGPGDEFQRRIEVGYGLEGVIPDVTAEAIYVQTMRPHLKEGEEEYFKAFSGAIDAIGTLLKNESTGDPEIDNAVELKKQRDAEAARGTAVLGILIIGAFIATFLGAFHWSLAGLTGTVAGGIVGFFLGSAMWLIIVLAVIGFPIGILASIVIRAIAESSGSGGYGGGYGGGSSGGSSGGGGFSGGGGSFGGGGAGGGR
jgi:uncharacterized protein